MAAPITAEIVRNYLDTTADEVYETLCRSSEHPIVAEGKDCGAGVYCYDGVEAKMISRAGIILHSFAQLSSAQICLDFFRGDLDPGDVMLVSDPYHGGSHIGDYTVVVPIFFDDAGGVADRQARPVPNAIVNAIERGDPELASSLTGHLETVERTLRRIANDITEPVLAKTTAHLVAAGGMRIRPVLALLSAQFGEPRRDDLISAATLVELAHVATLCHDDVMDRAALRRGAPSVNARWGNKVAVLTGDRLLAAAGSLGVQLGEKIYQGQTATLHRLILGQAAELVGPTVDEDPVTHYFGVVANKTAALLEFAAWAGATVADAGDATVDALTRYARSLGIAFQLRDDLLDIAPAADTGKAKGTDLRQGVRTLPVIYALIGDDSATGRRLRELLSAGPITDETSHREALTLLVDSPAMSRTRDKLRDYTDAARRHLDQLPAHPARRALASLCDFLVPPPGG